MPRPELETSNVCKQHGVAGCRVCDAETQKNLKNKIKPSEHDQLLHLEELEGFFKGRGN